MKRVNEDMNQYVTPKTPKLSKEKSSASINRDPVHVYCRLRPLHDDPEVSCVKLISSTTLTLTQETKACKDCNYIFRHIFTSLATQREVSDHVALPLVEDLLNGKNALLFTYGVTGSGKTFTLTGDQTNPGVMQFCIKTVFNTIGEYQTDKHRIKTDGLNGFKVQSENDAIEEKFLQLRSSKRTKPLKSNEAKQFFIEDSVRIQNFSTESRYAVFVSYTEIYNNKVVDLLSETTARNVQGKIIRKDAQKNMYVNGALEVEVKSAEEAYELFFLGQKRKRMAHTVLNSESSRSHSIFNIRVVQIDHNILKKPFVPEHTLLKVSQLSLVDLAGSERCSRTQNTGVRLKEASSINKDLMWLRACMEILRENQLTGSNKMVPYRESKLTMLFRNYFDGDGQVRMIVCMNPSMQDLEENLQVLKFAEVTQEVKVTKSEAKYTPYAKTPKSTKTAQTWATPRTIKKPLFTREVLKPKLNLVDCKENDAILDKLLKSILLKKRRVENFTKDCQASIKNFRKRLIQVQEENILGKSELTSMKVLLRKEKNTKSNLENKIADLESLNNSLITKGEEYQGTIESLNNRIEEKNLKINQNALERAKAKQVLVQQNEKYTQELDEKLRRQREHLNLAMQNKDAKLKMVQEILNDNESNFVVTPVRETVVEPRIIHTDEVKPSQFRRNTPKPNRHRRSRSAGEVYLEHNAIKPVPLTTVLQPCMKKRKSVTKLDKAKDITNPNQNRYCLITQAGDTDGGVETKLYKGDILPTCGGGAQVIFSDVEKLKQESPTGSPIVYVHK